VLDVDNSNTGEVMTATDCTPTVGERLKAWLAFCGITQHELALLMDVADQQVVRWVKGHSEMKVSTLARVLETLNVSPAEFHSFMPPPRNDDAEPGFGDRLAEAILDAGTTQRGLGEDLGVHPTTVGRWVHGTCAPPDLPMLQRIADVLGCKVDALLGRPATARTKPKPDVVLRNWMQTRNEAAQHTYAYVLLRLFEPPHALPPGCITPDFFTDLVRLVDLYDSGRMAAGPRIRQLRRGNRGAH